MGTKSGLLALLERQRGNWISGQQAAASLGVSRAAVWKAVEALRGGGLEVESQPGRGYRLAAGSDVLSPEGVRAWLQDAATPLRVLDETPSTNLVAKEWALAGAAHGSMVLAARQSAGRGRRGRSFASPPGGLYLSVVLRPAFAAPDAMLVTAAAAVAVCRAVAALCGVQLGIKWVNDLYCGGKKCCGILTEAATGVEAGSIDYLVVGIGVNYTTPPEAFAGELAHVATSLFPAGGAPVPRARLAAGIHGQLLEEFARLPERRFLAEYRRRSVVLGREVTVMATPPYRARALAIDDDARLLVATPDGEQRALAAGEISVQR